MGRLIAVVALLACIVVVLEAAPPTIAGLSPVTGTTAGGTEVTIAGSSLDTTTGVTFGGVAAAIVSRASNGSAIVVTAPAHAPGQANVVVTNPSGSATLPNGFTYLAPDGPAPSITNVTPNKGSTIGSTQVTITGRNFRTGATVHVGSTRATDVTVLDGATITANTPAASEGSAGAATVKVTNSDATSATAPAAFTYVVFCGSDVTTNCITELLVNGAAPPSGIGARLMRGDDGARLSVINANNGDPLELAPAVTTADEIAVALRIDPAFDRPAFAMTIGAIQDQGFRWNSATREMTVVLEPRRSSWNAVNGCELPPGTCAARATVDYRAAAVVLMATPDDDEALGSTAGGLYVSSDAQTFSIPQYDAAAGAFRFRLAAPSRRAADTEDYDDSYDGDPEPDGDRNNGLLTFFIPAAFIANVWHIADPAVLVNKPASLRVTIGGELWGAHPVAVAATTTSPAGLKLDYGGFHFSAVDVTVAVGPTVTGIDPQTGPSRTGTPVRISGLNFRPGATVKIGDGEATEVHVVSSTTITALTPEYDAASRLSVRVENSDGTADTLLGAFTFHTCSATPPGPNWSCVNGGWVPPSYTVPVPPAVACATPQPAPGWSCVNGGWVPPPVLFPAPVVRAISPASERMVGGGHGGTPVTITGEHFRAGATVTIGPNATDIVVLSATTITAVTPVHNPSGLTDLAHIFDVVVTNTDGRSGRLGDGFTAHACPTPAPVSTWVCVQGGWVPPDHPLASGGSAGGTPPNPGGSSGATSCTTLSPGAGWICVNGGWVPPNHPSAASGGSAGGGSSTGSTGTAGSTACTTTRPSSDWVCVDGGWVPPSHPLATSGGSSAGPTNWWPWNGTATDVVGGQNGTLHNGISFAPGAVGNALSFDGWDDFAAFGSSLGNFGTSDFTIHFWIRTGAAEAQAIVEKRPICATSNFWGIRMLSSGQIIAELDQDHQYTNYIRIDTARPVNDGNFHHVALVRQGTTASVFVDGTLDGTRSAAGITNLSNSADLSVGRSVCSAPFAGLLDELVLYNRALTAGEIQNIFNAGVGCTTPRPAANWVCVAGGWVPPDHPLTRGGG